MSAKLGRRKKEKRFAVIDAETDPFDGKTIVKPFIWGFYDGIEYRQFDTVKQIVNFLRDKDYIVYAHNGGKFDYHFMLEYMDPMQELTIINGRISKFKIGDCEFRDSYNIIPIPLREWQKDDFDYDLLYKHNRDIPENRVKIEKYLKSDCYNLFDMVTAFIGKYGLHLTQATAALKTWQAMSGAELPQSDEVYYDFFSDYYYGGRVECFENGYKKIKYEMVDINSAYPDAMCHKHPFSTTFATLSGLTLLELKTLISTDEGLAGFYHIKAQASGCFPYRGPDGSLYFPNDETVRQFKVSGWEILAALDTNTCRIDEIYSAFIFYDLIDFKNYILHFYALKKQGKIEGDKGKELFAKLLMNSLYGKFAAHPDKYRKYKNVTGEFAGAIGEDMYHELMDIFDGDEKEVKKHDLSAWYWSGNLGPWALAAKELSAAEQRYYNIATSASITGFVRAKMWRAIQGCEGVIYCDTDSIAAVKFSDDIKLTKELGDWDKEGEFTDYSIGGKKMYAFKYAKKYVKQNPHSGKMITHKIASKGVKFSAAEIKKVAQGETVTYNPEAATISIHKEPKFIPRNVKKTSKNLANAEEQALIKKNIKIAKNLKKWA